MSALQRYLNAKIAEENCSVREYAKRVGMPRTTLTRKLTGESDFTLAEIRKISRALGYESISGFMQTVETAAEKRPSKGRGFAIQDKRSSVILLEGCHVALDGGDAA